MRILIVEDDAKTADFVGNSGNGTFQNGRVGKQSAFYFERSYTVTAAFYDVVATSYKPKVAVAVSPCGIACVVHIVFKGFFVCLWVFVIFSEKSYRVFFVGVSNNQSANNAVFARFAVFVNDVYFINRRRFSH